MAVVVNGVLDFRIGQLRESQRRRLLLASKLHGQLLEVWLTFVQGLKLARDASREESLQRMNAERLFPHHLQGELGRFLRGSGRSLRVLHWSLIDGVVARVQSAELGWSKNVHAPWLPITIAPEGKVDLPFTDSLHGYGIEQGFLRVFLFSLPGGRSVSELLVIDTERLKKAVAGDGRRIHGVRVVAEKGALVAKFELGDPIRTRKRKLPIVWDRPAPATAYLPGLEPK